MDSAHIRNPHGTCQQIPLERRNEQILSCIRNPFARYVSIYEYGAGKTAYQNKREQIQQGFPDFPELSFQE
jgi:hypothetical protein